MDTQPPWQPVALAFAVTASPGRVLSFHPIFLFFIVDYRKPYIINRNIHTFKNGLQYAGDEMILLEKTL